MSDKKICEICGQKLENEQQAVWHKNQHAAQKLQAIGLGFKAIASLIFLGLFIYILLIILRVI